MPHILARLKGVKFKDIEKILKADADEHAGQGLFLEHLWQNADDEDEVLFLFRTKDLDRAKRYIDGLHAQALKEDPKVNLPQMTFLKDE